MPSSLHERLVQLFRERPGLAADLLSGPLFTELSKWDEARAEPNELARQAPTPYLADLVLSFRSGGKPVQAVVVEAQLRRDTDKRRRWPVYVTSVHDELHCPTYLLVVSPDRGVAQWCAQPIALGHPGFTLTPLVLGPDVVPVVTDEEQGRAEPELAVLSAIAHGDSPAQQEVLRALLAGLRNLGGYRAGLYADVVAAVLSPAALRYLKELVMGLATSEPLSDLFRPHYFRGKAEGRAEEAAEAVLTVLAARGIDVPDDARQQITECADLEQLETWIRRAATATSVEELFA
jgi:hypothetical protein